MEHFWLCCHAKSSELHYYVRRIKCGMVCIPDSHLCICTQNCIKVHKKLHGVSMWRTGLENPPSRSPIPSKGLWAAQLPWMIPEETFSPWEGPWWAAPTGHNRTRQAGQRKEASLLSSLLPAAGGLRGSRELPSLSAERRPWELITPHCRVLEESRNQ